MPFIEKSRKTEEHEPLPCVVVSPFFLFDAPAFQMIHVRPRNRHDGIARKLCHSVLKLLFFGIHENDFVETSNAIEYFFSYHHIGPAHPCDPLGIGRVVIVAATKRVFFEEIEKDTVVAFDALERFKLHAAGIHRLSAIVEKISAADAAVGIALHIVKELFDEIFFQENIGVQPKHILARRML